MKPMVLMIGADKGGVGKTTIARTVLDYLGAKNTLARAFDAEYPRGTLKRFHPDITEIVDITAAADQMKMIDTLATSQVKVSVIDIRAGLLSPTLKAFTDIGFFDLVRAGEFNFGLFHVVGPSVASLDEIADVMPYAGGEHYFVVKNFINDTSFFEWNPAIYKNYFKMVKDAAEINIPKLNEMAYEQVELAGVPFATSSPTRRWTGQPGNYSLVLRGYVRTWLNQISRGISTASACSTACYERASAAWRLARDAVVEMPGMATNMSFAAIVASLHGRTGKTLLARVLAEYFILSGRRPLLFDTDAAECRLCASFPHDTVVVDLDPRAGPDDPVRYAGGRLAGGARGRRVASGVPQVLPGDAGHPLHRRGARAQRRAGDLLHRRPQCRFLRGGAAACASASRDCALVAVENAFVGGRPSSCARAAPIRRSDGSELHMTIPVLDPASRSRSPIRQFSLSDFMRQPVALGEATLVPHAIRAMTRAAAARLADAAVPRHPPHQPRRDGADRGLRIGGELR